MAGLSCGIVGLPNVGKSTLFNALTSNRAEASNYPFCTIDPNVGVVEVSDSRLQQLASLSRSLKIIPAATQFVDIAGLVAGASKGEGLGNRFLANIRETDAIVHVVRCFDSEEITHVSGGIDPVRDIEIINLELILSDLQMVENLLLRLKKQLKASREAPLAVASLEKVQEHLNRNLPVRTAPLTAEEFEALRPYPFLTQKKVLYVANVDESSLPGLENRYVQQVREHAAREGSELISICCKLEEEIAQLEAEERKLFLESRGVKESGRVRKNRASFKMLGLITYLTTGEKETRAWTIQEGQTAPDAAAKIHTDLAKGFIRAEVVAFEDFISCGSRQGAREQGKARSEGRDYIVRDGDVILFYHN